MRNTFFLYVILALRVTAQSVYTGLGARAEGIGNASAALTDAYSTYHNPAGIAWATTYTACFAYSVAAALEGANRLGAAGLLPTKYGVAGITLFRFGDDLYSESLLGATFANRLGIASLGARVNYLQYRANGLGTHSVLTIDAGGVAELTPGLKIGAWIQNLNRPALVEQGNHTPVRMTVGLACSPADHVTLVAGLEKDLDNPTTLKCGLEYVLRNRVYLRSGFNLKPNAAFFGTGYTMRRLQFDYALQYNLYLRTVHSASVILKPAVK